MGLRVGIDLVSVETVRAAVETSGARYLQRVHTPRELEDCDGDPRRLAACFAAKEAALKALQIGDEAVPWRSIELLQEARGAYALALSGPAAALAARADIGELAVSVSHAGGLVSAVVLARLPSSPR